MGGGAGRDGCRVPRSPSLKLRNAYREKESAVEIHMKQRVAVLEEHVAMLQSATVTAEVEATNTHEEKIAALCEKDAAMARISELVADIAPY